MAIITIGLEVLLGVPNVPVGWTTSEYHEALHRKDGSGLFRSPAGNLVRILLLVVTGDSIKEVSKN